MQDLFPRALVACIAEGRQPHDHELAIMSEKVLAEALGTGGLSHGRHLADELARLALSGSIVRNRLGPSAHALES